MKYRKVYSSEEATKIAQLYVDYREYIEAAKQWRHLDDYQNMRSAIHHARNLARQLPKNVRDKLKVDVGGIRPITLKEELEVISDDLYLLRH